MKYITEIESANIKEIKKYLSMQEPYLANFLRIAPDFNLKINSFTSVYQTLIESIISQQLSGKAAFAIFNRLCQYFNSKEIRPLDIFRCDDEELQNIGISMPKIKAIRDLTEYEMEDKLPSVNKLHNMSNCDIIKTLTQIKGIGNWTVEMLLIFRLGRIDVISGKDYSLRKGFSLIKKIYPNIVSSEEMLEYAELYWKPYRSIASWYLWRACEGISKLKG